MDGDLPAARLTFACTAVSEKSGYQAALLAASIRAFGGRFSESPIWILVPQSAAPLPVTLDERLAELAVRTLSFEISEEALSFPFAAKVVAAAAAETLADDEAQSSGEQQMLVWMDSGSVIVQEPMALLPPAGKKLAYRPVDHTLIGSRYDQPADPFWRLIYHHCHVAQDKLFPMVTSVDGITLRPYFNAGMLVVRPNCRLLRSWSTNFMRLYRQDFFAVLYRQNHLYHIFVHQAILAGTLLAHLSPEEMQQLSYLVNYPLHMHHDYPADRRPVKLNQVVSFRYENLFDGSGWRELLPIDQPLLGWLDGQID